MSTQFAAVSTQDQLGWFKNLYDQHQEEEMELIEYLELCRGDASMYAGAHDRLLRAIGEPVLLDTSTDERLSRIFSNRVIRTYRVCQANRGNSFVSQNKSS